jgi:hypothetical protein
MAAGGIGLSNKFISVEKKDPVLEEEYKENCGWTTDTKRRKREAWEDEKKRLPRNVIEWAERSC